MCSMEANTAEEEKLQEEQKKQAVNVEHLRSESSVGRMFGFQERRRVQQTWQPMIASLRVSAHERQPTSHQLPQPLYR